MFTRRILAIAMAVLLVGLPAAAAAAQPQSVIGSISGLVDTKNLKGDYLVRLRDVMTGQVIASQPQSSTNVFSFTQLPLAKTYLLELVDKASNRILATQGPILLSTTTTTDKTGVILSPATTKTPVAMWLLAAGAGTAATVSAATASGSR
jgi:hypothetical protein